MQFFKWLKSLFISTKEQGTEAEAIQTDVSSSRDLGRLTGETTTGISYHPSLVSNLKDDHHHLLGLYGSVLESIDRLEYSKIAGQLEVFKTDFNAHLSAENIKFYGYLEQSLKEEENEEDYKSIRTFRREMNSIAKAVNKFLTTWASAGIDSTNVNTFTDELKGIGAALVKRIESEETALYPIYDQKK